MTLPVTTHNIVDWVRRAATDINLLLAKEGTGRKTFRPQPEPMAPEVGMTYFDSTINKLRTYDGTVWQDHW